MMKPPIISLSPFPLSPRISHYSFFIVFKNSALNSIQSHLPSFYNLRSSVTDVSSWFRKPFRSTLKKVTYIPVAPIPLTLRPLPPDSIRFSFRFRRTNSAFPDPQSSIFNQKSIIHHSLIYHSLFPLL